VDFKEPALVLKNRIDAINKVNLRKLSEKELRTLENSDNLSQHFKKQVFEELTNRNLTGIKKLRQGTSHRPKKNKGGV
jgi:hypothetical protein